MKKIFTLFLFLFLMAVPAFAGGGRIELHLLDNYGDVSGKKVRVEAKLTKSYQVPSIGEKAEFRLVNPRSGDFCTTFNNISDSGGYIRGECGSNQVGRLTMYVHSFDENEDTYTVSFQIVEAPLPTVTPTNTPTPTPVPPTPIPTAIPVPPTSTATPLQSDTPTATSEPKIMDQEDSNDQEQQISLIDYINIPLIVIGVLVATGLLTYSFQLKKNLTKTKSGIRAKQKNKSALLKNKVKKVNSEGSGGALGQEKEIDKIRKDIKKMSNEEKTKE